MVHMMVNDIMNIDIEVVMVGMIMIAIIEHILDIDTSHIKIIEVIDITGHIENTGDISTIKDNVVS